MTTLKTQVTLKQLTEKWGKYVDTIGDNAYDKYYEATDWLADDIAEIKGWGKPRASALAHYIIYGY